MNRRHFMKGKFFHFSLFAVGLTLAVTACNSGGGKKPPAHIHSWSDTYTYDDTYHWKECSGCDEISEKAEHNVISSWISATFEKPGHYEYSCSVCDWTHTGEDEGDPLPHNYSSAWTQDGEDGHYHQCIDAGYEELKTPTESHDYGEEDWTIDYDSTETSTGLKHKNCIYCGYRIEETIPVKPHVHIFSDDWAHDSSHHWHNSTCGHNVTDAYAEHDFTTRTVEPSFDDGGYTTYTCKVCGYSYNGDYKNPKVHQYEEDWHCDETYHWHACTDEGYEDNMSYVTEYGEHSFGEWQVDLEPTKTEKGHQYKECRTCSYRIEEEIDSLDEQALKKLEFELNDDESGYILVGYNDTLPETLSLPDTYKDLPVVEIYPNSFAACSSIKHLILGKYIKVIGESAFESCYSLETVTFNEGLEEIKSEAFNGDSQIQSLIFPSTLKSIGEKAFNQITNLGMVTFNEGLESIGYRAFYKDYYSYTQRIETVTIPSTVTSIGIFAISAKIINYNAIDVRRENVNSSALEAIEEFNIGNQVTYIPRYIVSGSETFESVTVPASVEEIEDNAFFNCSFLEVVNHSSLDIVIGSSTHGGIARSAIIVTTHKGEVTNNDGLKIYKNDETTILIEYKGNEKVVRIPDGVETIKKHAFYYTDGMYQVIIPSSVTTIEDYAFYNCSDLLSIVCLNTEINLNGNAFTYCGNTKERVYSLDDSQLAFDGDFIVYQGNLLKYVGEDSAINLPEGYTSIGDNFASNNSNIESVVIPVGYTSIGTSAFGSCRNLKSITLPETLKEIKGSAFAGCTSLESVAIPNSVTSLYSGAFKGCSALSELYIGTGLTALNNEVFANCTSLESVIIPDTISSFTGLTFTGCTSLKTVTLPKEITYVYSGNTFDGCTSLEYNTYGNGKYLGKPSNPYYVFIGVEDFEKESVEIHDDCEVIDYTFFYGYYGESSITSLTLGKNLKYVPYNIYDSNNYDIEKITTINYNCIDCKFNPRSGYSPFCPYNSNEEFAINVGEGVKTLSDSLFYGMKIKSISIPNSIEKIGSALVKNDQSLVPFNNYNDKALYLGNEGNPYVYLCKLSADDITTTTEAISDGCKVIGPNVFQQRQFESIIIPEGVTSIGTDAFYCVFGIKNDIVLPDSLKYMGNYVFSQADLNGLAITLPAGLEEIGTGALQSEPRAKQIFVKEGGENFETLFANTVLGNKKTKTVVFATTDLKEKYTEITIPSPYTYIGASAFGKYAPEKVRMPYISRVLSGAFAYSKTLQTATFDNGFLIRIDNNAFDSCENLVNVELGDNLENLESQAFGWCKSLKKIVIPKSLTSIDNSTFDYANSVFVLFKAKHSEAKFKFYSNIKQVYGYVGEYTENGINYYLGDDDNGKSAYPYAFNGATVYEYSDDSYVNGDYKEHPIDYSLIKDNTDLTHIVIPEGVTYIAQNDFSNRYKLKSIVIPSTVKSIGSYAFMRCSNLETVVLPEGLEQIGDQAFYECTSLKSIVIPSTLKNSPGLAFYGCSNLSSVTFKEGLETIDVKAFAGTALTEVKLPESTKMIDCRAFPISVYTEEDADKTHLIYLGKGDNNHYFVGNYFDEYDSLISSKGTSTVNKSAKAVMAHGFCPDALVESASVILPEGLEVIGEYGFGSSQNADYKIRTNIPSTVIEIGQHAFRYAYITNEGGVVTFNKDLVSIPDYAFQHVGGLTDISFEEDSKCELIGQYTFHDASDLNSVDLSNCVTFGSIGYRAFQNCIALDSLILPDEAKAINQYAFNGCSNLSYVYIPEGVIAIYNYAFEGLKEGAIIDCQVSEKPSSWNSSWYGNGAYNYTINWGVDPK